MGCGWQRRCFCSRKERITEQAAGMRRRSASLISFNKKGQRKNGTMQMDYGTDTENELERGKGTDGILAYQPKKK